MKKIVVLILAIAIVLSMCGCNNAQTVQRESDIQEKSSMFVVLEKTMTWSVVYHRDTKVMYAVSRGSYNGGNFTVLVNVDGTPMVYEE